LRSLLVIAIALLVRVDTVCYLIVERLKEPMSGNGFGWNSATMCRGARKSGGRDYVGARCFEGCRSRCDCELFLGLPILEGSDTQVLHYQLWAKQLGEHVLIGHAGSPEDVYWWVAAASIAVILGHIFRFGCGSWR